MAGMTRKEIKHLVDAVALAGGTAWRAHNRLVIKGPKGLAFCGLNKTQGDARKNLVTYIRRRAGLSITL